MSETANGRTALYRHFAADGSLLYVGISLNTAARTKAHSKGSRWFDQIARIDLEWHQSRVDAEYAEREAILDEDPMFNIVRPSLHTFQRRDIGYAVQDVSTGWLDGWYFLKADGREMLEYFKEELPGRDFRLLELPPDARFTIRDSHWLNGDRVDQLRAQAGL